MRQCFKTIKENTKKIALVLLALLFVVSFSLLLVTKRVFADGNATYSLSYNGDAISAQFGAKYQGNENGTKRSGLLLTSTRHGTDAEGTSFSVSNTLNGEFSMDFRVISEQRYQLNPNRGNKYGYTQYVQGNNDSFNALASDNWNPYQDLKEVAFTFTSKSDPSKYFVVYINGTSAYQAFLCTAKVYVPGDYISLYDGKGGFETKGYGLSADGTTTYTPGYWLSSALQQTVIMGTSFTNFVSYSEDLEKSSYTNNGLTETFSNVVRFDPTTMSVYVNGCNTSKYYGSGSYEANTLVRDIDDNTRFESANNYTAGSLDKSYFADGYSVKVTFSDVTADDTVGSTEHMGCPEQYKKIDEAYDRYARMLIYSVNGTEFNDSNVNLLTRSQSSFIKDVDSRLTVTADVKDTDKYTGAGLNFRSNVSGTDAEGASFTFADVMVGNFDTSFRVKSAKTYGAKTTGTGDSEKAYSTTQWALNEEAFFSDAMNPYNDLKEVKYEFISNLDASKKFSIYFRGAMNYYAYGMSVAVTVGDAIPTKDDYKQVEGYSFSNFYCDNGGWDYKTHALLPVRFTFEQDTMQVNVYGCSDPNDYFNNQQQTQYVGDLSSLSGDFNNGYMVKVTFTDVTANSEIGSNTEGLGHGTESNVLYNGIDSAYNRYIDFSIYSLNGQSFDALAEVGETTPRATVKKATFKANEDFDATPLLYDATFGNGLPLTGKVYYSTDNADFTEITQSNGAYVFNTGDASKYYIQYTGFKDALGEEIAKTVVEINRLTAYTLTVDGEAKTYYEGDVVDLASFIVDKSAEHKVFAGFLINDSKIYSGDYDLVMTADTKVDVYYVEFYLETGASIRLNKETPGIRFVANLSNLGNNTILSTFGVNSVYSFEITMEGGNTVTKDVTDENKLVEDNGDVIMCAAILGLTEGYYQSVFSCKFYVTVNYEDAKNVKLYALNDDNVRSAKQVAELALADTTKNWSPEQREILNMYAGIQEEVE